MFGYFVLCGRFVFVCFLIVDLFVAVVVGCFCLLLFLYFVVVCCRLVFVSCLLFVVCSIELLFVVAAVGVVCFCLLSLDAFVYGSLLVVVVCFFVCC